MNYLILVIAIFLTVGLFITWVRKVYHRIQTAENISSRQKTILLWQLGLFVVWCLGLVPLNLVTSVFGLDLNTVLLLMSCIIFGSISLSSLVNKVSIAEFIVWSRGVGENKILTEARAANVGILGLIICIVMGMTGIIMLYLY
jgi:hypothetical protein